MNMSFHMKMNQKKVMTYRRVPKIRNQECPDSDPRG